MVTKNVVGLNVSYRPGTADETVLNLVLARNHYGAVSSLDRFYYTSAQISNCEYRWEHR